MPRRALPVHQPVKELSTADLHMAQAPDADISNRSEIIIPADKNALDKDGLAALAFNEDHIKILIEPSNEENPPIVVDCWVNGKGAEVLDTLTGQFIELNCLPIGQPIITKRKYVEVIARSRTDKIASNEDSSRPDPGRDGWTVRRNSMRRNTFSVLHDPAGAKGQEWLTRLMAER